MILRTDLEGRGQLVESIEADFESKTWTFKGEGLKVSAGAYLIISLDDWRNVWDRFDERGTVGKTGG